MGAHSANSDETDQLSYHELLEIAKSGQGENPYMAAATEIHPDHLGDQVPDSELAEANVSPSGNAKAWTIDLIDRAVRTALQTGIGYLLVGGQLNLPSTQGTWLAFGSVVAAAVILSLATAVISAPTFFNNYWFQVIERAVKTFCQALVAGFAVTSVSGSFATLPHNMVALLTSSAIAAGTSLLTSVYTTPMGSREAVGTVGLSV
jgi:hypothetical protein